MSDKILVLSSFSALEVFLSHHYKLLNRPFSLRERELVRLPNEYSLITDREYIRDFAAEYSLSLPLQVLSYNDAGRRNNKVLSSKVMPGKIPKRSFLKIDESVYVSCPELCLLQIASELSLPKFVETINQLCASYVENPEAKYKQQGREPLTNTQAINHYLKSLGKVNGSGKVRFAVQYAADNANSPRECKIAALAFLPLYLGGFGLKRGELNATINFFPAGASYCGYPSCRGDIVWKGERLVAEYDSNLSHLEPDQHSDDKHRYSALILSNYKVLSITASDLRNYHSVEKLFESLRVALKMPARAKRMKKYENIRRNTVHEILFEGR